MRAMKRQIIAVNASLFDVIATSYKNKKEYIIYTDNKYTDGLLNIYGGIIKDKKVEEIKTIEDEKNIKDLIKEVRNALINNYYWQYYKFILLLFINKINIFC